MRIVGFYITGFGVLTNVGLDELSPGLNLILGDNGAGKSTLLEFFRAVLFGFRQRRDPRPRYEPLRGGTHGGYLVVETAEGKRYRIARTEGERVAGLETVMALDDGSPPPALSDLLHGASRDVFENVFAFSLAELQAVETLEEQEVQARLYAAGAGTGAASAPKVRESLEKQAKELYSDRGRSELGNVLGEARTLMARQRELSDMAQKYARLRRERDRLAEDLLRAGEDERAAAADLASAEALQSLWPDWLELLKCEADLRTLGDVGPLPDRAEERLEAARATVRAVETQVAEAERRVQDVGDRIGEALRSLGSGWTEEKASHFDTGERTVTTIREFGRELEAAAADATRVEAEVRTLEQAAVQAADARAALEEEERARWPEPPRALSSIESDMETVRAARNEATLLLEERARRSELEARRHDAEANVRRLREAPEPIAAPARIPLAIVLGALACAAAAVPLNKLVALAFFVVFLIAAAVAVRGQRRARALVRAQREEEIREAEGRLHDLEDRLAAADQSIQAREAAVVASLARFGVHSVASPSDIEPVERSLSQERDGAAEYAAFARRIHDARRTEAAALDRLDEARRSLEGVQAAVDAVEARWSAWLSGVGLPTDMSVQGALEIVERVRAVQGLLKDRDARIQELNESMRRRSEAEERVRAIVAEAGDVDEEAFREHARRWHERERLLGTKGNLEHSLIARAGSPERWTEIRAVLERSDEAAVRTRVQEARDACRQARDTHQQISRRQGEVDAELRQLETSEEQEQVAARLAELQAQAQDILQRWVVRRLCVNLLDEARARFERERQPVVVKRAGEYLEHITAGRYVRLIRPFSPGSQGTSGAGSRPELVVETPRGERKTQPQWNRGLLEQIYLCLRLGFIEDYCTTAEPLPVIMDDVLANFDPGHARRTADTLALFAQKHQVLYLTCHPETVEYLRAACPQAPRFLLEDYRLTRLE